MPVKTVLAASLALVLCAFEDTGPYPMKNSSSGEQVMCDSAACIRLCLGAGFAGADPSKEHDVVAAQKGEIYIQLKPRDTPKPAAAGADETIARLTRDMCLKSSSPASPH